MLMNHDVYYDRDRGEWRIDLDEWTTLVSDSKSSLEEALDQLELREGA
jgi:hypothetical protein